MGDRICLKVTNEDDTTPIFYGHWCGMRGLKVMIETIQEPANTLGQIMCNFIVKIMDGKMHDCSYDIWDSSEGDGGAADGDWGTWTYHTSTGRWTTTCRGMEDKSMTHQEALDFVKSKRPCLFRTCRCEDYGSETCWTFYYEKFIKPHEKAKTE